MVVSLFGAQFPGPRLFKPSADKDKLRQPVISIAWIVPRFGISSISCILAASWLHQLARSSHPGIHDSSYPRSSPDPHKTRINSDTLAYCALILSSSCLRHLWSRVLLRPRLGTSRIQPHGPHFHFTLLFSDGSLKNTNQLQPTYPPPVIAFKKKAPSTAGIDRDGIETAVRLLANFDTIPVRTSGSVWDAHCTASPERVQVPMVSVCFPRFSRTLGNGHVHSQYT